MRALTLKAPAKINLTLRVLSRRPDGYHEIDSLMVPVALFDTVTLELRQKGTVVRCPGHPELNGPANLAFRAAENYLREAEDPAGVKVTIDKAIPIQAGLGGGSSDAAAVLIGLQRLSRHPLSKEKLSKLAACLGADVPFFLQKGPCRARGIGNILEPVPHLPSFWLLLACAPFGISTRQAYESLKYSLTFSNENDSQLGLFPGSGLEQLALGMHNDLQTTGERFYPVIKKICEELLQAGATGASMTGSGPTVYGLFRSQRAARAAFARMEKERGWNYLVARGITSRKRATE